MKIGILEYQDYHQIYVKTLRAILEDYDVTIFNDYKMAQQSTKDLDFLFVNSIRPLPFDIIHWIRFKPKCKSIWTIHNANTELTYSKILLKRFDAINVFLPATKKYIKEKGLYNGTIYTIPFMIHLKKYENKNDMFVVPGKIEKFRRDYDFAFNMMKKSDKWCFLGKPIGSYGKEVLQKCKELNKEGYNIKTFTEYVEEEEYETILKECKAVVSPLRNPTAGHNRLKKEYYGLTKACGARFEAIKYGKPYISSINDYQLDYRDYTLPKMKKQMEEILSH